jgi:2-polyprenyl-6-methoxyphenol hydroxylase-like FAD-dependent oxidoreductase
LRIAAQHRAYSRAMSARSFEAVIVGGGIAGSALGAALAGAGKRVLILERSERFEDVVRGEWIAPWGVAELQALGLYELVRAAGGHHLTRHLGFDEALPPAEAYAKALPLGGFRAGVPGPLCIGHPHLCQTLLDFAAQQGATVLRGVADVRVAPGAAPEVSCAHAGTAHAARADLVVGADGRASSVRRQLGFALHEGPEHHLFAGLLVERAHAWPADTQAIGTEGDVSFLAFPQGNGRVRLYVGYAREQAGRFAGAEGAQRFVDACVLRSIPESEAFRAAKPAGPCRTYPNQDTWIDEPIADGVVLIGDAAGHNDPITGQGLSIALRDVRVVRDLLLAEPRLASSALAPYAAERRERMRRLRFAAAVQARLTVEFDAAARARRAHVLARIEQEPELAFAVLSAFAGPEQMPAEAFTQQAAIRIFGSELPGIAV